MNIKDNSSNYTKISLKSKIWGFVLMIIILSMVVKSTELILPDMNPDYDSITIRGGYSSGGITLIGGIGWFQGLYVENLTSIHNLNVTGDIIPSIDATYDIGNGTNRWRNANFSNMVEVGSLTINGVIISSDFNSTITSALSYKIENLSDVRFNTAKIGAINATSINTTQMTFLNDTSRSAYCELKSNFSINLCHNGSILNL